MQRWRLALVASTLAVGCSGEKQADRVDDILSLTGDAAAGEPVYAANCEECHRASGLGVDDPVDPGIGTNLTTLVDDDEEMVDVILHGKEEMPAFEDLLTDQEIADVLAYVRAAFLSGGAPTGGGTPAE